MKKNKVFGFISGILWLLVLGCFGIIITDYTLVKKDKEPMFCLKREVKEIPNGNTTICTGLGYKYYNTIGKGYVSKKFVPIWQKDSEDSNE